MSKEQSGRGNEDILRLKSMPVYANREANMRDRAVSYLITAESWKRLKGGLEQRDFFIRNYVEDHEKLFEAVDILSQDSEFTDFLQKDKEKAGGGNKTKLEAGRDIRGEKVRKRGSDREKVEIDLPSGERITVSNRIKYIIELLQGSEKPLSRNDVFNIFQSREQKYSISMVNNMFSEMFKVLNGTRVEVRREYFGASRNIIFYKLDVKNSKPV